MGTTSLIAFREFLEAFLIIGMFLGLSKKLDLKKETEIMTASVLGIIFSLLLPIIVYISGERVRVFFTENQVDMIQGYLMVFSGFFIAYVVFSLHTFFKIQRDQSLEAARARLSQRGFDVSIFVTVFFFIIREGFEVALFTATISLLSAFISNLVGLLIGFGLSLLLGLGAYTAYIKLPIGKIFKYTEYLIIIIGAVLVKNGISKLFEHGLNINLGNIWPLPLSFLPSAEDSVVGHALNNLIGLESEFSLVKAAIMLAYGALVYRFVMRRPSLGHTAAVK